MLFDRCEDRISFVDHLQSDRSVMGPVKALGSKRLDHQDDQTGKSPCGLAHKPRCLLDIQGALRVRKSPFSGPTANLTRYPPYVCHRVPSRRAQSEPFLPEPNPRIRVKVA